MNTNKLLSYEIIEKSIKNRMSEKRFVHSLGVAKKAEELAKIYGEDMEIARKTGIAHDIAKEMSKEESIEYAKNHGIKLEKIEIANPALLHGKIGANMVKDLFGFSKEMQNAIKCHTTGKENMTLLEKIIFVADKTEEGRKSCERFNIDKSRQLALTNLDEAIVFLLDEMNIYLIKDKKLIAPESILARNYIIMNTKN